MVIDIGGQSGQPIHTICKKNFFDAIQILLSITLQAAEDGLLLTACHHLYLIFFDLVLLADFWWDFWGCFRSNLSEFRFEDMDSCTGWMDVG